MSQRRHCQRAWVVNFRLSLARGADALAAVAALRKDCPPRTLRLAPAKRPGGDRPGGGPRIIDARQRHHVVDAAEVRDVARGHRRVLFSRDGGQPHVARVRSVLLALVVLEMARKMQTGSLPELPIDLPAALRQRGFLFLTWEVAYLAAKLPPIHKNPIDRALVAHAMAQKMPVLTCDSVIRRYGVRTIW
jgi:PIN domain nuclease of toxin-antitoxin system